MSGTTFTESAAFDLSGNLASSRVTALSAGEIGVATLAEVRRILKETKGNQLEAAKVGIRQLVDRNLITSREARDLTEVCESVFGAVRKKGNAVEAATKVRQIHQGMLVDHNVSPTALAITSIANSTFVFKEDNGKTDGQGDASQAVAMAVVITPETTGAGAVIGGIIGGVIGGVVGGGLGAGIGAAIGGAAGAAIGACNETGV